MKNVIIVESPSKSHTINSYLGNDYLVLSSKGHIMDLATTGKDGLGIDIENDFKPNYKIMPDKLKLVEDLKKQCKNKNVYLATDPDREGEAIAYHLANVLNLDLNNDNRIEFHEITKNAVLAALQTPHKIDLKMVESQETRRLIDRIVGFKLSKLLQRKIKSKSAGRVQSAALLMIVNLEKEIEAFIPIYYYEMEALFDKFKLKLFSINNIEYNDKNRILDRKVLENLELDKEFIVSDIINKEFKRQSQPPYTTSTLQQDASTKLNFDATRTMRVAQVLYEGKPIDGSPVGLITYMRTDSTRLSTNFVYDCRNYLLDKYGPEYIGSVKTKNQKGMQDAHEAIRPTSITRTPESIKPYLTSDEYKLYNLIYKRALASLMASAKYNQTTAIFDNKNTKWKTSGQEIIFDGYKIIYDKKEEDDSLLLPNFKINDKYIANEINILDKATEPKKRFTEATLIKEMELEGIGRPSTYAQTIKTLKDRKYIELEGKTLKPTKQGILTIESLLDYFSSIIDVNYTAKMESELDMIAQGEKDKSVELNEFYDKFMPLFDDASKNMEKIDPIKTDEICPKCGHNLVIRMGKYGEFLACDNYPKCDYIKKDTEESANEAIMICPTCKKGHIVKKIANRGKNKGHAFYSCDNYPKCKTIFNDEPTNEICPKCGSIMLKDSNNNLYCSKKCEEQKEELVICPNCNKGHLILRTANRGKNKGNEFYGCSNYPRCKTIISITEYNKLKN